eukprot:m.318186 g.318186  ORF g.318186 m.318186 type:complete len:392 (+) comp16444_c0_seq1:2-1177(+)
MATRGAPAGPAPRESARTRVWGAHKVRPASNLKQLRAKRAAMIHVLAPHKTWANCIQETQTSFQNSDGADDEAPTRQQAEYYEKQYKAGLAEDSMVQYLRKEGVSEVALQEILTAPIKRPAPADAPAAASTPKKKKRRKKSGRRSQPSPKTPVAVPKSREQYHAAYKSAGKKMREEKMTCREAAADVERESGCRISPQSVASAARNVDGNGTQLSPTAPGRPPKYPKCLQKKLVNVVMELRKHDVRTNRALVTTLACKLVQGTEFEESFTTGDGEIVMPALWFDNFWKANEADFNPPTKPRNRDSYREEWETVENMLVHNPSGPATLRWHGNHRPRMECIYCRLRRMIGSKYRRMRRRLRRRTKPSRTPRNRRAVSQFSMRSVTGQRLWPH